MKIIDIANDVIVWEGDPHIGPQDSTDNQALRIAEEVEQVVADMLESGRTHIHLSIYVSL